MVEAIIFDLGGVCLTNYYSGEQRRQLAQRFGLDSDKVMAHHKVFLRDLVLGTIKDTEYFDRLNADLDDKVNRGQDYIAYLDAIQSSMPDALALVDKLKLTYPVFAYTNELNEAAQKRNRIFNLEKHFSRIIVSSTEKLDKYDKNSFLKVCQLLGCNPNKVLYIDDAPEYVGNAVNVGLKGIVYRGIENLKKELERFNIKV